MTDFGWSDVAEIRQRHADGESQVSISEDFPVSQGLVSLICRNKAWVFNESAPEQYRQ